MSHFLLSVLGPAEGGEFDGYDSEEARVAAMEAVTSLNTRLFDEGVVVYVNGLAGASASRVVDARRGRKPIITDGPFAEFKEWLNGFWVVELPSLQAAVALAEEASLACDRRIEVRPTAEARPVESADM